MDIEVVRGKQIVPLLKEVSKLRVELFRQWPYLYEGDLELEKEYLKVYSDAEDSLLVLAKEGRQIVGIAIGLPVKNALEEIQKTFAKHQKQMDKSYYFADVLLLEEHRRKKVGLGMIRQFEQSVKNLGVYRKIYGCEVVRAVNDPRKPADYQSLDAFWESLGYPLLPHWETHFEWLDIGDRETRPHPMRFRCKAI